MVRGSSGSYQSAQTSWYRHHQHLWNGNAEAILVRYGNECHNGSGNGRTSDTHLRGYRRHTAGTLRTDAFFQRNVADNRHQRINHVTRSHQHGQEERTQRSQERDAVRMLAQQLFSHLNHPVHTARCL